MDSGYETIEDALNAVLGEFEQDIDAARYLDVNQGLISIYKKSGRIRPTLRKKLYEKFPYLKPVRVRSEVTWESEGQKKLFEDRAKGFGFDKLQDYIRFLADAHAYTASIENSNWYESTVDIETQ